MASLNKVMLIGNLTRDPDVRYTPKGTAVCDIGLAVNRRFINEATGERQEEVTYLDITLWGRQAEIAGQWLHKGRPVFIEGRLQMDTWEDRATGQKRNKIKVVCENLQLLGSPAGGNAGAGSGGQSYVDDGIDSEYGSQPPQARRNAGGGGHPQRNAAPQQRQASRPPAPVPQQQDDFGEGPITDGLDGDDIPF
ncbi:MAG: single-stranded DNA-binding protein [Prosthecobacter sp.]|jgi:single-strand DNA-binding protein|nr:single-stranded DNA-binding protein [Prosthecobacter sp.]